MVYFGTKLQTKCAKIGNQCKIITHSRGGRVLNLWNTWPEVPIWLGVTHLEFQEVPMGTNSIIFQENEIKVHKN